MRAFSSTLSRRALGAQIAHLFSPFFLAFVTTPYHRAQKKTLCSSCAGVCSRMLTEAVETFSRGSLMEGATLHTQSGEKLPTWREYDVPVRSILITSANHLLSPPLGLGVPPSLCSSCAVPVQTCAAGCSWKRAPFFSGGLHMCGY